jgi:phosphohistidine phosphatase SixA
MRGRDRHLLSKRTSQRACFCSNNIVLFADIMCALDQELVAAAVEEKRGEVSCVLCLGHNKGMEETASFLAVCHASPGILLALQAALLGSVGCVVQ